MPKHAPKKYFDGSGNLIIKPYRMVDLLSIFDVDYRTLRKWLEACKEEIGERQGNYYNARQVTLIVQKFGLPRIAQEPTVK